MKLSKEQNSALQHFEGPALVLAVPGAGKTTVLLKRTLNLIEKHGVRPHHILSITFSKAAATDMERRFQQQEKPFPVHFSTIHGLAYQLLRDYGKKVRQNYTLIESGANAVNKYSILKDIHRSLNQEFINEERLENLIGEIGYVKNSLMNPKAFEEAKRSSVEQFTRIYQRYESYKRENHLIDFDDMLTLSLEILQTQPDILAHYRSIYHFIQVDEGQDTSKVQVEIIRQLAEPKNNLFVVADDDQSIYGFRGAYPKWLLDFKTLYPKAEIFFMQQNYRSSENIVQALNTFIEKNKKRYRKTLKTDRPTETPIHVVKVKDPEKQYEYLRKDLEKNVGKTSAILYRNNISAIGLIDFLDFHQIPFYLRDLKVKFFQHWMLYDIFKFLRFAHDPTDFESFSDIFYKMKGYISRKQINYASKLSSSMPVLDRILDFPAIPYYYIPALNELKYDFRRLTRLKPFDAIEFIEYNMEYGKYLRENSVKNGTTYAALETILFYLKEIAKKSSSVDDFSHRLNYLRDKLKEPCFDETAVTLSTIHGAKGLEFDNVYIIDLIDGTFPATSSIDDLALKRPDAMEEERRLFYVGMSRAKSKLTLLSPVSGGSERHEPSRFIGEIVPKSTK